MNGQQLPPGNINTQPQLPPDDDDENYFLKFMLQAVPKALVIILVGFVFYVLISALGEQASEVHRHIGDLFRRAPHMFHDPRAFGAFVELLGIAFFFGWVVHRLMKFFGKK